MESRPTGAGPQHRYLQNSSARSLSVPSTPNLPSASLAPVIGGPQLPSPINYLPVIFPHQASLYQAQLLQYNKLIATVAAGRETRNSLQVVNPTNSGTCYPPRPQAVTRLGLSSSVAQVKTLQGQSTGRQDGYVPQSAIIAEKTDRVAMTSKDGPRKMAGKKKADQANLLPARPPTNDRSGSSGPGQSNSVPSTPQQHARKFSFESREPSPNAAPNHSPRSAYSETNTTLPSLRLPPRQGGCKYETAPSKYRRRMPYSIGEDRLEKVEQSKIKSRLSEDDERKLSTDMRELYDRLLPTDHMEENRQKLVKKLKRLFNDEWPGHNIEVHLFGSSGNLLCSDDSDVDICITTSWKDLEQVCKIAELLANHGMEKVVCVSSAKVPIVKIWDPELGLACDMNVNNTLALDNTRMVRTYVEIDDRVRPLAMIIKYWTRRRIVNDAAFGGTLSSYTWICMIIAFLQLQQPPVVPALHQRLNARLPAKNGKQSVFADDVHKLRNSGKKNKETLAALLFRFFKFYAHDFDYEKLVLSVRLGRALTRKEVGWPLTVHNMLCVEEPFNVQRNLGNTADNYSFRGLHLELRRAFDLIAEGKLEECCEQWVWPKEEERIWQRPAQVPRPVLVRSSSQTHSGRGGRGGFRGNGNRQFHRNSNPNRRASSSVAYENAASSGGFIPGAMLPQFPSLDQQQQAALWYQMQQPQQLHQDVLGNTLSALQLQEHSLRFQLYTQTQAFQQQQQVAYAHAQRMQNRTSSQPGDRARTNSLDNPPLSAPPMQQPDMYLYGYPMQSTPYYVQPAVSTYPSSPSTTTSHAPEFRRSLHRAAVNGESGLSASASLRSQSQPASRSSILPGQVQPGEVPAAPTLPDPSMQRPRGPIPSFIADETVDSEFEDSPGITRTDSPPDAEEPKYMQYFIGESAGASPARQPAPNQQMIPAFGDLAQGVYESRRRLSTDQIPQSILDRRMRRTSSRSPSPLGHARAFSAGTNSAPLSSAPFPPLGHKPIPRNRPLIVNGSMAAQSSTTGSSRQASASESTMSDGSAFDNPLYINSGFSLLGGSMDHQPMFQTPTSTEPALALQQSAPLIVNGSMGMPAAPPQSPAAVPAPVQIPVSAPMPMAEPFRPGNGFVNGQLPTSFAARSSAGDRFASTPSASARRLQDMSRHQPIGIVPLDLALSNHKHTAPPEFQHLSPVYEARTPSPTIRRKLELSTTFDTPPPKLGLQGVQSAKDRGTNGVWSSGLGPKVQQKAPAASQAAFAPVASGISTGPVTSQAISMLPRPNGLPPRPPSGLPPFMKMEEALINPSGWQKSKAGKRRANDAGKTTNGVTHGEAMPTNDAERKGG